MINKRDFIFFTDQSVPYRVRDEGQEFVLYIFRTKPKPEAVLLPPKTELWKAPPPQSRWEPHGSINKQNLDVLEPMLARALPPDVGDRYEHGMPFLPMAQADILESMAPHHNEYLLTDKKGGVFCLPYDDADNLERSETKIHTRRMEVVFVANGKAPQEAVLFSCS